MLLLHYVILLLRGFIMKCALIRSMVPGGLFVGDRWVFLITLTVLTLLFGCPENPRHRRRDVAPTRDVGIDTRRDATVDVGRDVEPDVVEDAGMNDVDGARVDAGGDIGDASIDVPSDTLFDAMDDSGDDGSADAGTDTPPPLATCKLGASIDVGGVNYTLVKDGLQVLSAEPNITAIGYQKFTAATCDVAVGDMVLNIFQTDAANGWDERHTIPLKSSTMATSIVPASALYEQGITHVNTIAELNNGTTLFNTDDTTTLTYVLRVYGASGLADCVAWGDDPADVFDGFTSSNTATVPEPEINMANCRTL